MFDSWEVTAWVLVQALPGQQTPDNTPSFKLVIVGDGGTGIVFDLGSVWERCAQNGIVAYFARIGIGL